MNSLEKLIDLLTYEQLDICDKENILRNIKQDLERLEKLEEKEVPIKPLYIKKRCGFFEDEFLIGRCPKCNTSVSQNKKYCYDCGQRLDWSE